MNRLIATAAFVIFPFISVMADDLFVPVTAEEQQELADKNFDFYHRAAFMSLPGKARIAWVNSDAFDTDSGDVTLEFFEGSLSLNLKSYGVKPINKRSALGLWTGKLDSGSELRVMDLSDGKLDKKVTVYVKLYVRNPDDQEYRPAQGLYTIKDQVKELRKQKMKNTSYIGPVHSDAEFIFAIHESDIAVQLPDNDWVIYRIQSLPNDPEFVVISIPDTAKQFDHADGPISASEVERKIKVGKEYSDYFEQEKRDKESRQREKMEELK